MTMSPTKDGPVPQMQADPVPVVDAVRQDAGDAPLRPLGGAGHAYRAAPDPPHRRARVLLRRRHEPRPELGLDGARQHARVHVERDLVDAFTCRRECFISLCRQ
jgi:hypothetical protein